MGAGVAKEYLSRSLVGGGRYVQAMSSGHIQFGRFGSPSVEPFTIFMVTSGGVADFKALVAATGSDSGAVDNGALALYMLTLLLVRDLGVAAPVTVKAIRRSTRMVAPDNVHSPPGLYEQPLLDAAAWSVMHGPRLMAKSTFATPAPSPIELCRTLRRLSLGAAEIAVAVANIPFDDLEDVLNGLRRNAV